MTSLATVTISEGTTTDPLVELATLYARTKTSLTGLEAVLADTKKALIAEATKVGLNVIETKDGQAVKLVPAVRRNFDVAALARKVASNIFKLVTSTKVDHDRYDAAVKVGIIDAKLVDAVATKTPYIRVEVD